jgi:hypothetical protein
MNEEQQRICIAEACGIKDHGERDGYFRYSDGQGFNCDSVYELPDYLHDLNAMRDAIQSQPMKIQKAMRSEVWRLSSQMEVLPEATVFAEAFLKTLGLWTDEPQTTV